ncbi:GAF domain-containing protein [Streptomyces longispororuber]|uniref:GAF domain-containing protein n=1 Tax=Streptomyces longispororuber TaxID=68230 RepID=A0A918ZGZ6_9ACTN|nr:GAF and ANTAR domain-containing protein [Streptomyces longispororuber]GHE52369.1 GAF domain-containing protein [Streptomyces longispororuber]
MGTDNNLAAVLESLQPSPGDTGLISADPYLCAQLLGVDGVAVCVLTDGGPGELLWSTGGTGAWLADVQYTLGQGPCLDVAASCAPVFAPDLSRLPPGRWPALLPEVVATGIAAVFCFPLSVGSACLGTLTLHRTVPGPLPDSAMTDAWLVADALSAVLLRGGPQQEAFAAGETSDFYGAVVHQATGMVSVQASVPLAQALLRLRAHAFRHGRTVAEVAEDVTARRLHFRDAENGPETGAGEGTGRP